MQDPLDSLAVPIHGNELFSRKGTTIGIVSYDLSPMTPQGFTFSLRVVFYVQKYTMLPLFYRSIYPVGYGPSTLPLRSLLN